MMKKLQVLMYTLVFCVPMILCAQSTSYNLRDQSTFNNSGVQWSPVTSTTSPDGKVRTQAATSQWHSSGYGIAFKEGNILEIDVLSGNNTIRFYGSVHSSGTMKGSTTLTGNDLGLKNVDLDSYTGMADQTGYYEFTYVGGARTLYFTFNGANAYTPAIDVNLVPMTFANTDVWDFGATQLSTSLFNNQLNETTINAWYGSTTPGTAGVTLPVSFTAGALGWVGATNDRLRTTNTALTRFDANIASVTDYTGRVYCNGVTGLASGLPVSRYITLTLNEDDEVKVISRSDTNGLLTFLNSANPAAQTNTSPTTSESGLVSTSNFVAKTAGVYFLFDATAKASFYRIYRKAAPVTLT